MIPIRFDPDHAALIGCAHLAPSWIFEAHDSIIGVDIGGTNIRCGIVQTRQKKASDLSKAKVWKSDLWRHAEDEPTREGAVKKLASMLKKLIGEAESEGLGLGKQQIQSAGEPDGGDSRNWRTRYRRADAQRRRRAGLKRNPLHAGLQALGYSHHRHRAWECALYDAQREAEEERMTPRRHYPYLSE
jgi:hypothetical protein